MVAVNGKQYPCDPIGQPGPDFPKIPLDFPDERHAQWPAELCSFNVLANLPLILARQFFQPFPHRLMAGLRAIKDNFQDKRNISHLDMSVPFLVRKSIAVFLGHNACELSCWPPKRGVAAYFSRSKTESSSQLGDLCTPGMGVNLWGASPLYGNPGTVARQCQPSTSRRQGRLREEGSEGSPSAKL